MTTPLKEALRAVGFMFTLSLVLITCVAALHLLTAQRVARNAGLLLQQAVMEVADVPVPDDPDAIAAWYARAVQPDPDAPDRLHVRDPATRETRTLVFRRQARGLWGLISVVIGADPATGAFRGLRILDQNETPGLGARITEPWFLQQIVGKRGPFTLVPEHTRSSKSNEIDAITGATVTSTAIRDLINHVVRDLPQSRQEATP